MPHSSSPQRDAAGRLPGDVRHVAGVRRRLARLADARARLCRPTKFRTGVVAMLVAGVAATVVAVNPASLAISPARFNIPQGEGNRVWTPDPHGAANVRSGPGTSFDRITQLGAGTPVTIDCHAFGQTITNPAGVSTAVWDHITSPVHGYITDALVFTNTNDPIGPKCGGTAPGGYASRTSFGGPQSGAVAAARAAMQVGFPRHDPNDRNLIIAVAIAGAESGWNHDAESGLNWNGTRDYGMWQINSINLNGHPPGDMYDLMTNARAMRSLFLDGKNWHQWCTAWSMNKCGVGVLGGKGAPFLLHMGEARAAVAEAVREGA